MSPLTARFAGGAADTPRCAARLHGKIITVDEVWSNIEITPERAGCYNGIWSSMNGVISPLTRCAERVPPLQASTPLHSASWLPRWRPIDRRGFIAATVRGAHARLEGISGVIVPLVECNSLSCIAFPHFRRSRNNFQFLRNCLIGTPAPLRHRMALHSPG